MMGGCPCANLQGTHQAFYWAPISVSDGYPLTCLMGTHQFGGKQPANVIAGNHAAGVW